MKSHDTESLFKWTDVALKILLGPLMHRMHLLFLDPELQSALIQASKISKSRTGKQSFLMRDVELSEGSSAMLAIINISSEHGDTDR